MKVELKGDAKFGGTEGDVTAHMYWPDTLTFGLAVHASPKLIILCDLEWIGYSRFSRKSHLTYSNNLSGFNGPFSKDMRDARRVHLGCEYSVNEKLLLRSGYLYNPWCVPDAQTSPFAPGNTYHTFHLGANVKITKSLSMDFMALSNLTSSRTVTNSETGYPGTYKTPCYAIDIALSYIF